jgi:trehalose-phosphatase
MAHLLNIWTPVSARLGRADKVLLLFDYDGTLTPIVQRPEDALLSGETRDLLQSAAALPKFVVGIVSGRGLEDLSKLANIPGLIHAGNHGMEIRGQGIEFTHPGAVASRAILDRAEHILLEALGSVPGVIVEHKGLTLTVHYRAVDAGSLGEVESAVTAATSSFVAAGELRLTRGKMVVEVRPAIPWDKGRAIERIREECGDQPLPVYFGDDRTDEDGFRVVQDMGGIAVFVGATRDGTVALHQLDSPAEVAETLRLLVEGGQGSLPA